MDFIETDPHSYRILATLMERNPEKSWRGFTSVDVVRRSGRRVRLYAVTEDRHGHYIQSSGGRGAKPRVVDNFIEVVGMTHKRLTDVVGIKLNYRGGSIAFPYSPEGSGKVHQWSAALALPTAAQSLKPGLTLGAQVTFTA